jgi:hypothetical protein
VDLKAEYVEVQRDYFGKDVDDFGISPDYDVHLVSGNVLLQQYGVIFIRDGIGQVTVTGTAAGRMQIDLLPFRDMDLALDGGAVDVAPLEAYSFHMIVQPESEAGEAY